MKEKIFKAIILVSIVLILGSAALSNIKASANQNSNDSIFQSNVVFYPQHQDDEVLWAGSAIVDAIKQRGADHVYVALISDGIGVNIYKTDEGFKNLTKEEKQQFRNNEFKKSLKALGVKPENIIFLADRVIHGETYFDELKKTILDFEKKFNGEVTQIGHHYKYDDHAMHRKGGEILKELTEKGQVKHAMFFIKPWYSKEIPNEDKLYFTADNKKEHDVVLNACMSYKDIDESNGLYGIGYKSSPNYFKNLLKDDKLTSILTNH
ncbi:PIG-L family deacetylase [Natronincola ferrireducens]|uniref:GlcNAc-PI de-N-acetylase n=1 Tax=Natronincola ferrireducens TaxID=393762 RepID=A0A1G9ECI2_9FIRM|nr:PIG-L family deacetylase [Natronincola ferrireducens]SDK73803.1 GlcNAc-PI de-N-acetylase [Natronincola ferrireducens]